MRKFGASAPFLAIRLALIVCLALIAFSIYYTVSICPPNVSINTDTAVETGDNWYAETGGDDENRILLNSAVTAENGEFSIYRDCTSDEINRGLLIINNMRQQVRVKVDDEEVYVFDARAGMSVTSVNGYIPVVLDKTDKDQRITITYTGCRDDICNIGTIMLCTPSEAFVHMFALDVVVCIFFIITIAFTAVVGVLALYLILKKIPALHIVYLFFILLTVSVWIISNTWLVAFMPLSRHLVSQLIYTSIMALPVPIGMFAYHSITNINAKGLVATVLIAAINILFQQTMYIAGVATFYDMFLATQAAILLVSISTVLSVMANYISHKSAESMLLALTFVVPIVLLQFTLILFWIISGTYYSYVGLSVLICFIVLLSINALHSLLQNSFRFKEAENEIKIYQALSTKDGLTGLGNRRSFDEHISMIEAKNSKDSILIFLDMNHLKHINDTYGHNSGDALLKDLGECISAAFSDTGTVYRIGGDEFAVLIDEPVLSDQEYFDLINHQIEEYNNSHMLPLSVAKGLSHRAGDNNMKRKLSLWKSIADREMYADKMRSKIADTSENIGLNIVSDEIDSLSGILTVDGFKKNSVQLILCNPMEKYAICYLNIKNFKLINDMFGYETGDTLIKHMASIALETLETGEICGRSSGNNILVLTKSSSEAEITERFNYIKAAVDAFFLDKGNEYEAELNAGVYLLTPDDVKAPNINQMLDRALLAQKSVNSNSGNRWTYFTDDMWESQWRELFINQSLEEAINNNEIEVWFQPQYNYTTGMISGAEALCRWRNNVLGWISPSEFIRALEKTGKVTKLDYHIWDQACKLLSEWRSSGLNPQFSASVNISRADIADNDLADKILEIVKKHQLPPSALHLEITESAYMDQPQLLIETINRLHEYGFTVEMDDFGSGYSSLSMLKELPVDILKIDIGFLRGESMRERGSRILGSIIHMARGLNMRVVTEGIETEAQANYVANMGCSIMQGYYFSKPIPSVEFTDLLESEKEKAQLSSDSGARYGQQTTSAVSPVEIPDNISEVFLAQYNVDEYNRITEIDTNFTTLLGYTTRDIKETALTQNDLIPIDDQEAYWKKVSEQSKKHQEILLKHRLVRKDGSIISVFCSGLPYISDDSGKSMVRIRIQAAKDAIE